MPDKPDNATTLDWRDIFWREWCHTEDEVLAGRLASAVCEDRPSAKAVRAVRGASFLVGLASGLSLASLFTVVLWLGEIRPTPFPAVMLLIGAVVGMAGGAAGGSVVAGFEHWRSFLPVARTLVSSTRSKGAAALSLLCGSLAAFLAWNARPCLLGEPPLPLPYLLPVAACALACTWSAIVVVSVLGGPAGRPGLRTIDRAASLLLGAPLPTAQLPTAIPSRVLQARAFTWWRGRPSREEFIAACRHPEAPEWAHALVKQVKASDIPSPAELVQQLMPERGRPDPNASEQLLWWEGKAMDALESAALVGGSKGAIAAQLARQIAERISRRFPDGVDGLLCPDCVTRFREHKARLSPVEAVTYYACRSCKQSKKAIEHSGEVVAVLDADDDRPMLRKGESLRVNWLARARRKAFEGQDVFDSDRVEVACASDEEVRHFLVDVTSDTDPARRKRYRAMECRIGPRCDLSENTLLALRKVFGAVTTSAATNRP